MLNEAVSRFEYWAEPAVYETFMSATRNTQVEFDGGIVRRNGDTWVLVKPFVEFESGFKRLKNVAFGAKRLRSVQYVAATIPSHVPRTTGDWSFYAPSDWTPSKELAYYARRGVKEGLSFSDITVEQGLGFLREWAGWAKNRHHMVIVGHYGEMIKDDRFRKQGWYLDGKLVAVTGFLPVEGGCVVTLVKHVGGISWLSRAIWCQMLVELKKRYAVIWCGDTAAWLKEHGLGLSKFRLYRVDFKKEIIGD